MCPDILSILIFQILCFSFAFQSQPICGDISHLHYCSWVSLIVHKYCFFIDFFLLQYVVLLPSISVKKQQELMGKRRGGFSKWPSQTQTLVACTKASLSEHMQPKLAFRHMSHLFFHVALKNVMVGVRVMCSKIGIFFCCAKVGSRWERASILSSRKVWQCS